MTAAPICRRPFYRFTSGQICRLVIDINKLFGPGQDDGGRPEKHSGKEATLERIPDAAEAVFSRAGLSGAPVDQIPKDAGATRQLLYHYFSSKNDIFVSVLNRQTERIVHELTEFDLESDAPDKALRAFLEFAFDQHREDSALAALAQEGIAYHNENPKLDSNFPTMAPALTKKIASLVERGVAKRPVPAGYRPIALQRNCPPRNGGRLQQCVYAHADAGI